MWLKRANQTGDTIIEVLISLSVLAFILTISYTMTSRSLQTIRRAHERSEALKIAEGQVEQIKATAVNNPATFFGPPIRTRSFCINTPTTTPTITPFIASNVEPETVELNADTFNYPVPCRGLGAGGLYNATIEPTTDYNNTGLFIVRVRWNKFGGGGNDEVKIEYKIFRAN